MGKSFIIESCWSDNITLKLKKDFIFLANSVFGGFITETYFKAKFINNIYGHSLITVAYVDNNPAGADAMWRNDIQGTEAYQTVDTCVLEQFRGRGLFKKITNYELDVLGKEVWIYGYPNANSYPGYVKMGWSVERLYKSLFLLNKNIQFEKDFIDIDYATWWLKAQDGITHFVNNGCYFLIRKKASKPIATVIGRVDEETAKMFPKTNGVLALKYFSKQFAFYNKNKSMPLIFNKKIKDIPFWKIDAV